MLDIPWQSLLSVHSAWQEIYGGRWKTRESDLREMLTVATLVAMVTCVADVILAWDQAQHWGTKEKKKSGGEKKNRPAKQTERWRHAFDEADLPSSN